MTFLGSFQPPCLAFMVKLSSLQPLKRLNNAVYPFPTGMNHQRCVACARTDCIVGSFHLASLFVMLNVPVYYNKDKIPLSFVTKWAQALRIQGYQLQSLLSPVIHCGQRQTSKIRVLVADGNFVVNPFLLEISEWSLCASCLRKNQGQNSHWTQWDNSS